MRYLEIIEDVVSSSWLADLDYVNGNVIMTTQSGERYTVYNVPEAKFRMWIAAESKGKFWHNSIKNQHIIRR